MTSRRAIAIAVLILGFGFGVTYHFKTRAQTVRHSLFSQTAIQQPRSDGKLETVLFLTEAVRPDGSWMLDTQVVADVATKRPTRVITLVPERTGITYDPETNQKFSTKLSDLAISRYTAPIASDCLQANPGPGEASCTESPQPFLGYRVMKLTRIFYPKDGTQGRVEALVAPSLDWKVLSYSFYSNGVLKETRSVTYIVEGESAPGLFSVPSDANEVKAAQLVQSSEQARGRSVQAATLSGIEERQATRDRNQRR